MLRNYLKTAVKVLLRRKFYTAISLFGICVTLVVLIVASALLDHMFAPQAPESRVDRLLGVYMISMRGEQFTSTTEPGYGFLDRWVRPLAELPQVERVALASSPATGVSYLSGRKIESKLRRTDGEYWRILDFKFLEGAPFTSADDAEARFVAVINRSTRERFFGGGPAVGKTLEVDAQRFRVVGVVEDVPILRLNASGDIWVPISTAKSSTYRTEWLGDFNALILARTPADRAAVKQEFQARLTEAEKHLPEPERFHDLVAHADTPFEGFCREAFPGDYMEIDVNRVRWVLALIALLYMLLPTINLINLNLSRILERSSEIGARKAFGASSRTLVGQFVVENLVVTLLGGLLALLLAWLVLQGLNASGLIPYARLGLNARIFVYGLFFSVVFGVLSGVYPAWRMSRLHPIVALRGRLA